MASTDLRVKDASLSEERLEEAQQLLDAVPDPSA